MPRPPRQWSSGTSEWRNHAQAHMQSRTGTHAITHRHTCNHAQAHARAGIHTRTQTQSRLVEFCSGHSHASSAFVLHYFVPFRKHALSIVLTHFALDAVSPRVSGCCRPSLARSLPQRLRRLPLQLCRHHRKHDSVRRWVIELH